MENSPLFTAATDVAFFTPPLNLTALVLIAVTRLRFRRFSARCGTFPGVSIELHPTLPFRYTQRNVGCIR